MQGSPQSQRALEAQEKAMQGKVANLRQDVARIRCIQREVLGTNKAEIYMGKAPVNDRFLKEYARN